MYLHLITITLLAAFFAAILIGAIITPTIFSVEMNLLPPQTQNYTPVPTQVMGGRKRICTFSYVFAGNEAKDTTILGAAILPKGARLMGGVLMTSATLGANVKFNVGLAARDGSGVLCVPTALETEAGAYTGLGTPTAQADSGTFLGSALDTAAAAAQLSFGNTIALNAGYVLRKDAVLLLTVNNANISAAANLYGYIEYVLD